MLSCRRFLFKSQENPDLLYVIRFGHTQMTITLLLCFIFGTKVSITTRQTKVAILIYHTLRIRAIMMDPRTSPWCRLKITLQKMKSSAWVSIV